MNKDMYPIVVYFILLTVALMVAARKHGDHKKGTHNLFLDMIGIVLQFGIMWWGHFFDPLFR